MAFLPFESFSCLGLESAGASKPLPGASACGLLLQTAPPPPLSSQALRLGAGQLALCPGPADAAGFLRAARAVALEPRGGMRRGSP